MGNIDMTEILEDPDFTDPVIQIIRESRMDSRGQNRLVERQVETLGIVQPVSGDTLQRLPDDLRNLDIRSFWLKGAIHATTKDKYPDILVFHGVRYLVQHTMPWTNWGRGWTEGVCTNERPA